MPLNIGLNAVNQLNEALHPILNCEDETFFATACYIIIDISTGELRYNAGHPSPLVLSSPEHRAEALHTERFIGGPALAISPDSSYTTFKIKVSANDACHFAAEGSIEDDICLVGFRLQSISDLS